MRTHHPMTDPFDGWTEMNAEPEERITQVPRLAPLRPNPLNASEIDRIIDDLDRTLDEYTEAA